jgi:hypothetical protein
MYQHGKFKSHPGQVKSLGEKTPPAKVGMKEEGQAPHGDVGEKHVTETHPGETQPHPATGVHAFHGHHIGGGKHKSYTHHDGGNVEVQHHETAGDMHQAMHEALPDDQEAQEGQGRDIRDGGEDFSDQLGGIGGNEE